MKLKISPLIISSLLLGACTSTATESVINTSQSTIESEVHSNDNLIPTVETGEVTSETIVGKNGSKETNPFVESESETSQTAETQVSNMTFSISIYTDAPNKNSSVKIQYPVFAGGDSEKINALVYNKVQSLGTFDTKLFSVDSALNVNYQSAVTLQNSKIVSMVFWGTSYIDDSSYETSDLYPLNIDLKTMKEVSLNDLYKVDTGFSEVFFNKAFFPSEPITSYNAENFSEMLKLQTPEYQTVDPFSIPGNVTCFLKRDGIVLSMPSVHATGYDHFEAQIKYSDIQQFNLLQENYWD